MLDCRPHMWSTGKYCFVRDSCENRKYTLIVVGGQFDFKIHWSVQRSLYSTCQPMCGSQKFRNAWKKIWSLRLNEWSSSNWIYTWESRNAEQTWAHFELRLFPDLGSELCREIFHVPKNMKTILRDNIPGQRMYQYAFSLRR